MTDHMRIHRYTVNDVEVEEEIFDDFSFDVILHKIQEAINQIEAHLEEAKLQKEEIELNTNKILVKSSSNYSLNFDVENSIVEENPESTNAKSIEQEEINITCDTNKCKTQPSNSILDIYSKPNLKLKQKIPSLCPSSINKRPNLSNETNKNLNITVDTKLNEDEKTSIDENLLDSRNFVSNRSKSQKESNTEIPKSRGSNAPIFNYKKQHKRDSTNIKQRGNNTPNKFKDINELIAKIENALINAKQLLETDTNDTQYSTKRSKVENENINMNNSIKTLKELLWAISSYGEERETAKQKTRRTLIKQQSLINQANLEVYKKKIKIYETEYARVSSRLNQILDPKYMITLKQKSNELDKISKEL